MADPVLNLFNGESGPREFLKLASDMSELSESVLKEAVPPLFNEGLGPFDPEFESRNDVELLLADSGLDSDQQDDFFNFVRILCRQTAKYDLADAEIREDFRTLNFDLTKWDLLVDEIVDKRENFREMFSHQSRISGVPRLKDVRWRVMTDEATGLVHYLDAQQVQVTLQLESHLDETEEVVTFEIPEEELHLLNRLTSELTEAKEVLQR